MKFERFFSEDEQINDIKLKIGKKKKKKKLFTYFTTNKINFFLTLLFFFITIQISILIFKKSSEISIFRIQNDHSLLEIQSKTQEYQRMQVEISNLEKEIQQLNKINTAIKRDLKNVKDYNINIGTQLNEHYQILSDFKDILHSRQVNLTATSIKNNDLNEKVELKRKEEILLLEQIKNYKEKLQEIQNKILFS